MKPHEIGVFDHAGQRLPRQATALAIWRFVRRPLKLQRMATITSRARGLSSTVRASIKTRAIQSLTIALDCAVHAGRVNQPLTINRYTEALAERWSGIYRQTRETWDTGSLNNFKLATVRSIRKEIIGNGVALHDIWKTIRGGVSGLYKTSAPVKDMGRLVYLEDDDGKPLPMLARFDEILDRDQSYQRRSIDRTRLLLADEEVPPRKIAQDVAGERPFDIMHVKKGTIEIFRRLEQARVWLRVPELVEDIQRAEAELAESTWPAIRREYHSTVLPATLEMHQVAHDPPKLPKRASDEDRFWNYVERSLTWKFRKEVKSRAWNEFITVGNRQSELARYNSRHGRLQSMRAIYGELRERGIADRKDVEIKSTFYKHTTRRFQAENVWPSEASSGRDEITALPPDLQSGFFDGVEWHGERPPASTAPPTEYVIPQRVRWFKARPDADGKPVSLIGLDVSGSQAQILAVLMGLRDVEEELRDMPFKRIVAVSAIALHRGRRIKLPDDLVEDRGLLEENAKGAMKLLYGAAEKSISGSSRRDPDKYGSGLRAETLKVIFEKTPIIARLRQYLDVCEAIGEAACAKNPAAGITVVDPLDEASFTWNPPMRRKKKVSSGKFTLYCWPPVPIRTGPQTGEYRVDKGELTRRIAPGLIQMLDALFAAIVVRLLNDAGIKNVVAIHDAFLVPNTRPAFEGLDTALTNAGRIWLPKVWPVYDVFEQHLPADSEYGKIVRDWRAVWEQRMKNCEAGRVAWPNFATKFEGAAFK
jgi:hypothetical protein